MSHNETVVVAQVFGTATKLRETIEIQEAHVEQHFMRGSKKLDGHLLLETIPKNCV